MSLNKFECTLCHRNARWPGGILVSPSLRYGTCEAHLSVFPSDEADNGRFVRFRQVRVERPATIDDEAEKEPTPKRLAIGLPGGFEINDDKSTWEDVYTIVQSSADGKLADVTDVDEGWKERLEKVKSTVDALSQALQSSVANMWGGDDRPISKFAVDLPLAPSSPPQPKPNTAGQWACDRVDCDVLDNVWVNLSDGSVLCGRRQMLSMHTMQNGNMHALKHYEETGKKYPLVVKMGTIDVSGQADVYSYEEDTEVTDPKLREHLARYGFDMSKMQKTCRTLEELQVELNLKHDWSAIGGDKDAVQVYGRRCAGLVNMGNTCYMNSVLQALTSTSVWHSMYSEAHLMQWLHALNMERRNPHEHLNMLLGKVLLALDGEDYSKAVGEGHGEWQNGVTPMAFRQLIGRGHPEFSTNRQQDAEEFLRHLLDLLERDAPPFADGTVTDAFRFKVETRMRDCVTSKVGFTSTAELILSLTVDVALANNLAAVADYEAKLRAMQDNKENTSEVEVVCAEIDMQQLVKSHFEEEIIQDGLSPVTGTVTGVGRRVRLQTMPEYLWVTIRRFAFAADGQTPLKLAVAVQNAHHLSMTQYRGTGAGEGEVLLDDQAMKRASQAPVNQEFVDMLIAMGFADPLAREAVKQTQNVGAEPALNWLLEHPDAVPSELMEVDGVAAGSPKATGDATSDGEGEYDLNAIVVHLGRNTGSGHYVAYAKAGEKWLCYNDERVHVVEKEKVPVHMAYLMQYKRANN